MGKCRSEAVLSVGKESKRQGLEIKEMRSVFYWRFGCETLSISAGADAIGRFGSSFFPWPAEPHNSIHSERRELSLCLFRTELGSFPDCAKYTT